MLDFSLIIPLFHNAALLMAMVVVCSTVSQHYNFPDFDNARQALLLKTATGLLMGILCIAIIMAPVQFSEGVIFDTRSVLVALVGLFFGGIPLLITVLMASLFRLYLGGDGVLAGITVITVSGLCGLVWYKLRKPRLDMLSIGELLLFGFLVHALMMLLILLALPAERAGLVISQTFIPVLIVNPLATVLVGKLLSSYMHKQRLSRDLLEQEQQLRIAMSASAQDLFEMNLQTGEITSLSDEQKAEKYPLITVHDNIHEMLKEVHPDDRDKLIRDFARAQKGEMDIWEGEFRQRNRENGWSWIFVAGQLVSRDWKNQPLMVLGTFQDITHRKKSEEELQVFRELVDSSSDAIEVIDASTGRILDVNRTGCEELGYSREELLQMHIFDIDSAVKAENFTRGTSDRLKDVKTWEGMHRRKDGSTYPVDVNLKLVSLGQDYIVAVVRNSTERKLAEEARKLAAMVYENSREAMMVIDNNRLIMDVNPTFSEVTGYRKDEVLGKSPAILHSDQHSQDFYDSTWEQLAIQGHWTGEAWHQRKNGEEFPVWLSLNAVLDDKGKPYRWVGQFTDISDKKQAEKQIWQQANIDGITDLPNRSMFSVRLAHEIKRAQRSKTIMALLFLDLDRFKDVNDTFGHHVGDQLLKLVAERLVKCLRETDTIARLGGDEFTIILPELKSNTIVASIAQKILDQMATPFFLNGNDVFISASIGITLFPDDGNLPEVLLKNADQAMYMAKKDGRNRSFYFTAELQEKSTQRSILLNDLRQAEINNNLMIYYQPIVDLKSGRIAKAEALLRWKHPEKGFISPSVFIPLAEESGLVVPLGNKVLQEVLGFLKYLHAKHPDFSISINKSPVQFTSNDDNWLRILKKHDEDDSMLVVEITEGLLLEANTEVQARLQSIFASGLEVALDDFGTGYSSLAYLKKFNISYLKIDRSFVKNLAFGNEDHTLCDAMITMAHNLGIKVIAEGVETEQQRMLLMQSGCDYGQGYLFARAMPRKELEDMLDESAFYVPGGSSGRKTSHHKKTSKIYPDKSASPPD